MSFNAARKIFSIIFLAIVFVASVANVAVQRRSLNDLFSGGWQWIDSLASIREYISVIENAVNDNVTGKHYFIDGFAYLHILMGKNEMSDFDQVRSKHGMMNYGNPFPVATDNARRHAARLARMKQQVEADGARLIFLSPTDRVIKGYTSFEPGLPSQDLNALQDAFLTYLREYGVDYLDTRHSLPESDLPLEKYVYKTDHHWTIEACFEVFIDLVEELNQRYDAGLDPGNFYRDKGNYIIKTYHDKFLGSLGRITGLIFSGVEDFTLIWPEFESDYTLELIDMVLRYIRREGPAEKSLLYAQALKQTSDPYMMNPYSLYLTGIAPWVKIVNRRNPDGPRLMMINDSYGTPLACFLAPLFSEIHMIWPLADNPVSPGSYLDENSFDYVLVELYPGNLIRDDLFFEKVLVD